MVQYFLYYTNMFVLLSRCLSAVSKAAVPSLAHNMGHYRYTPAPGTWRLPAMMMTRRQLGFVTPGVVESAGSSWVRQEFARRSSRATMARKESASRSSTQHNGRPTMVTSVFSTATTTAPPILTKLARPAGAARLNFIDFNPGAPTAGAGSLTPVVIMHGLLGNARNFQGWGAKLVKNLDSERRVFAVDMRNHGASSHHDSMTYVDMADDVLGFLADQGLSEAVLVGHSMGGKAAAMTALLHPDVVKGLMVMDISPVSYSMVDATNWGETQKIIEAIYRMPLEGVKSRRDADELLAKDIVDPALRAFAVTNLDKSPNNSGAWEWRINISAIQRSMGVLAQFDSGVPRQATGRTRGLFSGRDAFFVAGGNSGYIRSQHLGDIRKLFPSFVLSSVKGAGHWVHADNPTETLRLAKSFLDRPELG